MSQTRTATVDLRRMDVLSVVCRRLGIEHKVPEKPDDPHAGVGSVTLFERTPIKARGWFKLPNWRYPIVVEQGTNKVLYDDYEGQWGDVKELEKFTQQYALEGARLHFVQAENMRVESEIELENGVLELTLVD